MESRNIRIDIIRVGSMLGIITLHILGIVGVRNSLSITQVGYWIAYFLEVLSGCSVDVFAVMSGYLLYGKKRKLKRIIELIATVLFFSILITAFVLTFCGVRLQINELLTALLPI